MAYVVVNDRLHRKGVGDTLDAALIDAGESPLPAHLRVFDTLPNGRIRDELTVAKIQGAFNRKTHEVTPNVRKARIVDGSVVIPEKPVRDTPTGGVR